MPHLLYWSPPGPAPPCARAPAPRRCRLSVSVTAGRGPGRGAGSCCCVTTADGSKPRAASARATPTATLHAFAPSRGHNADSGTEATTAGTQQTRTHSHSPGEAAGPSPSPAGLLPGLRRTLGGGVFQQPPYVRTVGPALVVARGRGLQPPVGSPATADGHREGVQSERRLASRVTELRHTRGTGTVGAVWGAGSGKWGGLGGSATRLGNLDLAGQAQAQSHPTGNQAHPVQPPPSRRLVPM
jgi:hypothetical protein